MRKLIYVLLVTAIFIACGTEYYHHTDKTIYYEVEEEVTLEEDKEVIYNKLKKRIKRLKKKLKKCRERV